MASDEPKSFSASSSPLGSPPLRWILPSLAVVIVYAWIAFHLRWNSDDAFVSFRAVANLLAGYGPTYNVAERVEAFTNPLWVYTLAALSILFGIENLEWIAVWAGIICSSAGLGLLMRGAARLHADNVPLNPESSAAVWVLPVFGTVLVGIRAFQEFATSGLETGLAFLLIGFSLGELFDAEAETRSLRIASLLSLLPLVRPDFAIYLGIFGAWLLLRVGFAERDRGRRIARCSAVAGCLIAAPASYQFFRMGYYALLVPNTALAKEASAARWDQGIFYLQNFTDTYHLGIVVGGYSLLAATIAWRWRSHLFLQAIAACALASVLHAAYVVRVGGDFMHARLLLPDLLILLAPLAALPARERTPGFRLACFACAAALAWAAHSTLHLRLPYEGVGPRYVNNEWTLWRSSEHSDFIYDNEIDRSNPPTPTGDRYFLAGNAGILAYSFVKHGMHDVLVIEYCGLADPVIGHLRVVGERGFIGHEKCVVANTSPWVVGDRAMLRENSPVPRAKAAFAERVLGLTVAGEYLRAIREPLGVDRFLSNVRNAARYTAFRLPPLSWFREVPSHAEGKREIYQRMMFQSRPFSELQ